jgi:hypothetical protein
MSSRGMLSFHADTQKGTVWSDDLLWINAIVKKDSRDQKVIAVLWRNNKNRVQFWDADTMIWGDATVDNKYGVEFEDKDRSSGPMRPKISITVDKFQIEISDKAQPSDPAADPGLIKFASTMERSSIDMRTYPWINAVLKWDQSDSEGRWEVDWIWRRNGETTEIWDIDTGDWKVARKGGRYKIVFEHGLDQLRPASRPNSGIFGSMMDAPAGDPEATLRDWCLDNAIIGLQSNGRIEGGYLDYGDNAESMSIPNREGLKWINLVVDKGSGEIKYLWRRFGTLGSITQVFSPAQRQWVDARMHPEIGLRLVDPADVAMVPEPMQQMFPADVPDGGSASSSRIASISESVEIVDVPADP